MLALDISRALRSHLQLRALVDAVVAAGGADEGEWLEWKSALDLSSHEACGSVARHVLGFANRRPERANRWAGGCGYLLVGAMPGEMAGVTPIDPAVLEPQLRRFIGEEVEWSFQYVDNGGRHVLVVIVEPPKPGDVIHPLQAQFGKYAAGQIFVRQPGRTDLASPSELAALQRRLLQRGDQLQVALEWNGTPLTLRRLDLRRDAIEPWLRRERRQLLSSLDTGGPSASRDIARSTAALQAMLAGLSRPEDRKPEQFREEVEQYLERVREPAVSRALASAVQQGLGRFDLALTNLTDRNFAAVALELTIKASVFALDDDEELSTRLPARPRPWGTPRPSPLYGSLNPSFSSHPMLVPPALNPAVFRKGVEIDNSKSARLMYDTVELRPRERVLLSVVHLFGRPHLEYSELVATWSATSTSADGVASGELVIPVHTVPVTTSELLEWLAEQDRTQARNEDESER